MGTSGCSGATAQTKHATSTEVGKACERWGQNGGKRTGQRQKAHKKQQVNVEYQSACLNAQRTAKIFARNEAGEKGKWVKDRSKKTCKPSWKKSSQRERLRGEAYAGRGDP